MSPRWNLCLAPLLLLLAAPALAWYPPVLIGKWGSNGSLPGEFSKDTWLACDASGNVYASDRGNHRIQKFNNNGALLLQWGGFGSGDGQFNQPTAITLDPGGDVYVANWGTSQIKKFTNTGTFLTKWGAGGPSDGEFRQIKAIATDAAGNVYACDSNHRVQKFSGTGTFLAKWGTEGTGDGQFSIPTAIAVGPNGHVYVLDVRDAAYPSGPPLVARIQEFTTSGTFIRTWGSYGVADSQFVDPVGMAIDGAGRVYVDDNFMSRVCVFTSNGVFLGKWGTFGTGGGQFYTPRGITVDGSDHVFVTDEHVSRVQKFGGSSVAYYAPTLGGATWNAFGQVVHFNVHWSNPNLEQFTLPLSASLLPQPFGAFLPDGPPVASFDVPPIPPGGQLDVFVDVPLDQLPPSPPRTLPGGGPGPADPCPPPGWAGNVDVVWSEGGVEARSDWHGGDLLVAPGSGYSYIHVLSGCPSPQPARWTIAGVLPEFSVALIELDHVTPAPDSLPPGWQGLIRVAADGGVPPGTSCCFDVFLTCDDAPGRIHFCAITCDWEVTTGVPDRTVTDGFGIVDVSPNPSAGGIAVRFALANDDVARLDVFDAAGRRLRTLVDGTQSRGNHVLRWDGLGAAGERLGPGTYFLRLRANGRLDSRAVARIR